MTEIPEHLLKRSKERRAALGLPGGEGGETTAPAATGEASEAPAAAETAPAMPRSAAPVPAEPAAPPPPPPPPPPHVAAAHARRRIPYWAMPVVALLPVWAYLYLGAVTVPPIEDDVLTLGEEVYSPCSSCHGATGQGGVGQVLNNGEVLATFADPKDMMMWINLGAAGGAREDGTYGDPDREGGPHDIATLGSAMPSYADLDAEELAAVTRYIRETLSGEEEPDAEAIEAYEALAEQAIEEADAGELPGAGSDEEPPAGSEDEPGAEPGAEPGGGPEGGNPNDEVEDDTTPPGS